MLRAVYHPLSPGIMDGHSEEQRFLFVAFVALPVENREKITRAKYILFQTHVEIRRLFKLKLMNKSVRKKKPN